MQRQLFRGRAVTDWDISHCHINVETMAGALIQPKVLRSSYLSIKEFAGARHLLTDGEHPILMPTSIVNRCRGSEDTAGMISGILRDTLWKGDAVEIPNGSISVVRGAFIA